MTDAERLAAIIRAALALLRAGHTLQALAVLEGALE